MNTSLHKSREKRWDKLISVRLARYTSLFLSLASLNLSLLFIAAQRCRDRTRPWPTGLVGWAFLPFGTMEQHLPFTASLSLHWCYYLILTNSISKGCWEPSSHLHRRKGQSWRHLRAIATQELKSQCNLCTSDHSATKQAAWISRRGSLLLSHTAVSSPLTQTLSFSQSI